MDDSVSNDGIEPEADFRLSEILTAAKELSVVSFLVELRHNFAHFYA